MRRRCSTIATRRRHAAAGHAEHELHDHRVVEQALVAQLQREADVAGVEALDLRAHAELAELRGHPPQERQVALEELLAEVDRAAVEARHLGRELERAEALVAHGAAAGAAAGEVDDRLAAGVAQRLDEPAVGLAVLRRRAVGLARVQVDDRGAGAPRLERLGDDRLRRRRQVGPALGVGVDRPGDRALDDERVRPWLRQLLPRARASRRREGRRRLGGGQRAAAARPGGRGGLAAPRYARGLDGRDVEAQRDLVADGDVAAAERHVELDAEVAARDLADGLEADAVVAPRIDLRAADLGEELDLVRDVLDREVAGDLQRVLVDRLDRRRLERDLRVALDVEEVGAAQVLVAAGLVRVDRCGLDRAVGLGGRGGRRRSPACPRTP